MHQIIFCTCPNHEISEKIAQELISKKLAACVNIIPAVISVYLWQNKIEKNQEHLLIIKSRKDKYNDIEKAVKFIHPYEVPEIISVPIENGLPEYLQWIDSSI